MKLKTVKSVGEKDALEGEKYASLLNEVQVFCQPENRISYSSA
jgi:hypothetical protein